jgi:c-di-GMP-binding flagellar brake protein YcgR
MALMKITELKHHQKNAIAVGSKVSVEKNDYISTGMVTYIEGDIIEIEMSQSGPYIPGEPIKLTVYSTNGFLILASSVIAKDTGVIMVLNPPENQRLATRRQFPRIDIRNTGELQSLRWSKGGEEKLASPTPIVIRNVSIGGIGFVVPSDPGMRTMMVAGVSLHINGGMECAVEISRKSAIDDGTYIGARFLDLDPERSTMLRGYILRSQVEQRAKQRIEDLAAM